MSRKGKALETSKRYMFDYEKGEYIEKPEFSDAKAKPYGIIYARVSDPKQVEQGDGIESQIDNAERYAERNNITVLKIFTDEAKTGAKLTREGLLAALAYIKQENRRFPKIGYFLCSEISRLSRSENIGDTTEMVNKISATWACIIGTMSGRNMSSKNLNDSFVNDIDIIRAKHERLQIRERSMNGTTSKLYKGIRTFSVPSGYERKHVKNGRKTEKVLERKQPEAEIIKEGLELFAEGIIANNTQLMHFFNEKRLTSNFHTPNTWKISLTYVQRLFDLEKLYFYAGYILFPSRGITKPVDAQHQPLITLSIVNKILARVGNNGLKSGIRKDISHIYPLRGTVYCPNCDKPMTWWPSTGKMKKVYHYYGCNRKECRQKEYINVDRMHMDFEQLLGCLVPKPGILALLDTCLADTIKEKKKMAEILNADKRNRIKEIVFETDAILSSIGKLSKPELVRAMEEKRANLNAEKEILEQETANEISEDKYFETMYARLKNIIEDPASIRRIGSPEMKILLARVLFGEKMYYTKKWGYQTPHLSALYAMFGHFSGGMVTSGAPNVTFIELFNSLVSELKSKEDIVISFEAHLKRSNIQ